MQKLLRKPPCLSSCGHGNPISLPLSNSCTAFLSVGYRAKVKKPMSFCGVLHNPPIHRPRNPLSFAQKSPLSTHSYRSCKCAADKNNISGNNTVSVPFRAWVVFKEKSCSGNSAGAAQRAWFTTQADKGDNNVVGEVDEAVENVKSRAQRRNRSGGGGGGGSSSGVAVSGPDLLSIPGVGPRNLRKLLEKGFEGVAQLKQLYKDKFYGKSSEKMVEFLQSSVGIIHKNHAESITTYIMESVDKELKDSDTRPAPKKRITLCVEGNISVGKTTFLQRIANETLELRDLVEIVPEPIDKWQNVGPDHFNILDAFYAEPERYAYTFQNYVFVTRVMQEKESSSGIKPLRLMERSVFSDRMVFVRAVHEAKWMNEMEISIYDSWFDPVVSSLPGLIPDGFIYLRASPDTCHKRMMLRKREEEGGVSLDYLRDLHEKHESWLFPFQSGNHGVLSVSKLPNDVEWNSLPNIKDRVFYLDGDHMHSSIRKVPALVLDCEPDIDFSRDIEAKREYARQVAEFFEFLKQKKEVPCNGGVDGESRSSHHHHQHQQPSVLLPHNGKLWIGGTKPFQDSAALSSLDFRRAMSITTPQ